MSVPQYGPKIFSFMNPILIILFAITILLLRALHHDFWQRWRKEYLSNLQTREKRKRDGAPIREGDVVLIVEDNVAPLQWPCGRIVKLIHGSDNIARVAVVKTVKGNYTKPIVKLRRLPTEQPVQPQ